VYTFVRLSIQTIFFDLDDTLYPQNSGVWQALRGRIELYMHERLRIPKSRIPSLRQEYLAKYGTSLRGLIDNYQVDPDEYLIYVHDLPIEQMLRPNHKLIKMLANLQQSKWIFTNASLEHARRVLSALGASDFFAGIVDVKAMSYRNKPEEAVYKLALERSGQPNAGALLFVDDHVVNIEQAKRLGARTAMVGTREPHPSADVSIALVEDLLDAYPALVESPE
jgi:putative hydrolase of the HAD superfamily